MGANMVRRLQRGGHTAVVFDPDQAAVQKLVAEGATGAASLDEFVAKLESPKTAWVAARRPVIPW
jgi:6-phosphogluconate dehydrogenase